MPATCWTHSKVCRIYFVSKTGRAEIPPALFFYNYLHMSKNYSTFALEKLMNKNAPEILSLRLDIENELKRRIKTPYDFEFLAGVVWERLHENISPTTLKRLWGYIDGADTTRRTTLCLLSRFLGYADWEAYMMALALRNDVESETFAGEGVRSDDLQKGQLVEVTWLPNRRCVFRYEGANRYVVTEAQNAKLQAGDRFETACFLIDKPMYLDNLIRGKETPVSYVAGSRNGLHTVQILNDK